MSAEDETAPGEALIGTVLGGRYRIEQLLGSGGMGAVYRAEHVHMRKAVAVKVLHREMTLFPEVVARFEREAVVAARIEHPNVASASDFGRLEDGSFYLVLEFVEGRSLGKLIAELERVPEERALRITRQIAAALSAAHAASVVHRDLKPENVMLVHKEGNPDFVKVLDFGIAKMKAEDTSDQPALTQAGTVFGTPEYMAPEQARGDPVDARADLYTVGMILYEMLAGQTPFKDDDLVVILTRQLTMDPPPLPADVSPGTAELVMHLLQKSPDKRPQTADELVARIDALLGVSPAPPSALSARSSAEAATTGLEQTAIAAPVSASSKVAYAPTVLNATAVAVKRSPADVARALVAKVRPLLVKPVPLRGKQYPLWMPLSVLGGLVLLGFSFTLALLSGEGGAAAAGSAAPVSAPRDDAIVKLLQRAETGDRMALAELSARDEKERSGLEWRALGHGYSLIEDYAAALRAYKSGIAAQPGLAKDPIVVADLRRAIEREETSEGALELVATALGATGADLIHAVWDAARSNPQKSALAKRAKALLDGEALRAQASPALSILLDLPRVQKAEGCKGIKALLPRITEHADERAVPLLKRYNDRRGCGFLGLSDCYACLRKGKDLANAIAAAEARPAPELFGQAAPEKPASSAKAR